MCMCVGVPKDFLFGSIYFTLYLPSLFGLLLSVACSSFLIMFFRLFVLFLENEQRVDWFD